MELAGPDRATRNAQLRISPAGAADTDLSSVFTISADVTRTVEPRRKRPDTVVDELPITQIVTGPVAFTYMR